MFDLRRHADRIAARRVAEVADAVTEAAGDVASDLSVERIADGVAIRGPRLVRRLAFDGRLRGLTVAFRSARR